MRLPGRTPDTPQRPASRRASLEALRPEVQYRGKQQSQSVYMVKRDHTYVIIRRLKPSTI